MTVHEDTIETLLLKFPYPDNNIFLDYESIDKELATEFHKTVASHLRALTAVTLRSSQASSVIQDACQTNILLCIAIYGRGDNVQAPWTSGTTASLANECFTALPPAVLVQSMSAILAALQPTLHAYTSHQKTEPLKPYSGPDSFQRSVAACQLCWLIQQVTAVDDVVSTAPTVFPSILSCIADPAPLTQAAGLWMLSHMIGVLKEETKRIFQPGYLVRHVDPFALVNEATLGCDEQVWPAAAAALVDLALHFESSIDKALDTLVSEALLHQSKVARALVWLQKVPQLFPSLGIGVAKYFAVLMPLLCSWARAHYTPLRIAALETLSLVLELTEPRIPAHANVLWKVLKDIQSDEVHGRAQPSKAVITLLQEVSGIILKASDESFRKNKIIEEFRAPLHSR